MVKKLGLMILGLATLLGMPAFAQMPEASISSGSGDTHYLARPHIIGGSIWGTDESNGIATASGSTIRRENSDRYTDETNVLDYGAKPSPSFDNTAAFQSAIDAACNKVRKSSGGTYVPQGSDLAGGDVFVPQGTYGLIGPVNWTCAVRLRGAGPGTTKIAWIAGPNRQGILFNMLAPLTDSNRYWYNGAIHDLNIANIGSQPGTMIRIAHCAQCDIYNIMTWGAYRSVVVFAGMFNHIHDFQFQQGHEQVVNGAPNDTETLSTAIEFFGSDNKGAPGCTASDNGNCPTRADGLSIFDGTITAALDGHHEATDCIFVHDFAATMWLKNVACAQTRNGLNVRCDHSTAINNCPQFLDLDRFETETNNTAGTNTTYNLTADNFGHIECRACEFYQSQAGDHNVVLSATRFSAGNFQWFGGKIQKALKSCIVAYASGVQFFGGEILDCGQGRDLSERWGIQFIGSTNNSIIGTQFCHDGVGGTSGTMRPVMIDRGSSYTIVNSDNVHNCAGPSQIFTGPLAKTNSIVNEVGP
ncbi:glycosyl hydrolase family 28-related protein [Gluconobacter sphaericus]|uniref:glycosyl hydrolase family 28-related protein n=1 Tax=Gluconobacter sphaericus TaxID=574987 RepID=UPI00312BC67A